MGRRRIRFYQCITEFIFAEDKPEPADIIFVPGGPYPEAAAHAAELYRQGLAPYVLPSGKYSILKERFEPEGRFESGGEGTGTVFPEEETAPGNEIKEPGREFGTECDYLCDILLRGGVPESAIIREDQATFTWENAIFSRKRLEELGIAAGRAIISCQAFHARRCLMYYQEQFPDTEFFVCPVVTRGISRDTWHLTEQGIDTVLGEVERCGSQFHQIMRDYMGRQEDKDD